jgi:hypothetical protein
MEETEQPLLNPATWVALMFARLVVCKKKWKGGKIWKRALYIADAGDGDMVTHLEKTDGSIVPLVDFDQLEYDPITISAVNAFRKELRLTLHGKSRRKDGARTSMTGTEKKIIFGRNAKDHNPNSGIGPFRSPLPSDIHDKYEYFHTKVLKVQTIQVQTMDSDSDTESDGDEDGLNDGTIGLCVGDFLELESHKPQIIDSREYQIIDFERDTIRVGPHMHIAGDILKAVDVNNHNTTLKRVRQDKTDPTKSRKKAITHWDKIKTKRFPQLSQTLLADSLKNISRGRSTQVPMPEIPEGYKDILHPTLNNNVTKVEYKVYGDVEQKGFDEAFTNIGELAYPPVYEEPLQDTVTQPSADCMCFICGKAIKERTSANMSRILGMDLTQAYKWDTLKWTLKDIKSYVKIKLAKHVEDHHADTPFHYLVPWSYTVTHNHQVYSSAIRLQEMLWKAFHRCMLPLGLFFHISRFGNDDTLLKCHLSQIIGYAMSENEDSLTLKKKSFIEKWQPDCVDTVNVDEKKRRDAISQSVNTAIMEVAKALRCLGEGLRCFDFVQFIDICSKSENVGAENAAKFAWNSVCLLFSRGLFISARLPFVPPNTLLLLGSTSIVDSANQLYNSPPELEIMAQGAVVKNEGAVVKDDEKGNI